VKLKGRTADCLRTSFLISDLHTQELLDTETSRIQRELERERAQLKIQEQHLAEELSRLKQKSEQASSKEIVSERTVRAGKRILIFMIIVRLFIRIWRRFILKGKT